MATQQKAIPSTELFIADNVTEGQYKAQFAVLLDYLNNLFNSSGLDTKIRSVVDSYIGSIKTQWQKDFFDKFYPVGTHYITTNKTWNPGSISGTWTKVGEGLVLKSTQDANLVGTTFTGVSSINYTPTITVNGTALTVEQLPSHSHTLSGTLTSANNTKTTESINTNEVNPIHNHTVSIGTNTGGHTHTVTVSNLQANNKTSTAHTHERGTMEITGKLIGGKYFGEYGEKDNGNYNEGALSWSRGAEKGGHDSAGSSCNIHLKASNGWSGKTTSEGSHTHYATIPSNSGTHSHTITCQDNTAGAHKHSLTVNHPAHSHTVNLSGGTVSSVGSGQTHTHTATASNLSTSVLNPGWYVYVWYRTA